MNSSGGASAGGLTGAILLPEREERSRERDGEQAAELWLALAQQVTTAEQARPLGQSEPTSAWRASAGDLTPSVGGVTNAAEASAEQKTQDRLVLRVDGGALGELEVTLDRDGGALRVVIGMENQHLVGSVLPDAGALKRALEGLGLNVQSLNVVPASEVGTVLAQRRVSQTGATPAAEDGREPEPERNQKRTQKRLTLIG